MRIFFRWIIVFPSVFMAAFLITFPIHWVVMLIGACNPTDMSIVTEVVNGKECGVSFPLGLINSESLERIFYSIFVLPTVIYVAYNVAPKFKLYTSIFIGGIIYLLIIIRGIIYPFVSDSLVPEWENGGLAVLEFLIKLIFWNMIPVITIIWLKNNYQEVEKKEL